MRKSGDAHAQKASIAMVWMCQRMLREGLIDPKAIKKLLPPQIVEVRRTVEKRKALRVLPGSNHSKPNGSEPQRKKLRFSAADQPSTSKATPKSAGKKTKREDSITNDFEVLDRVNDRRKDGAWADTRLPICEDAPRPKTHWDFLLEEMRWMALVARNERNHRKHFAKKMGRWILKRHNAIAAQQARREPALVNEREARRHCGQIAQMIEDFWAKAKKLVDHFQEETEEATRRRNLENELTILVAEADKMSKSVNVDPAAVCRDQNGAPKSTRVAAEAKQNGHVHHENGAGDANGKSTAPSEDWERIAQQAQVFQPKGNTLETADIQVESPELLEGKLREYQLVGLNWLYALHEKNLNGILADEMGLGKTIQTISLFAYLATKHNVWGPHLVVVPTSVILNWEMELKKWCPSFKVLTYFGSAKDRAIKRKGWNTNGVFDVCITSYKLFTQDARCFKKKQWQYLVLDEAQHIKNFESQRWQSLINLRTRRRLLLTGTPLQNNLMELWSLLHFLMPAVFSSRDDFKDWFNNPISEMIEGNGDFNSAVVQRLHKVLRPFILRRLKSEVEKQLPSKTERVILCELSKRQRYLYNEFMSLRSTVENLRAGSIVSVLNIVMQLRKCCNHPNLFEPRDVQSPFFVDRSAHAPFCRSSRLERADDRRLRLPLEGAREIHSATASSSLRIVPEGEKSADPIVRADDRPVERALREIAARRHEWTVEMLKKFILYVPAVVYERNASPFVGHLRSWWDGYADAQEAARIAHVHAERSAVDERALTAGMLQFPEVRLIEYDCGKLQTLALLLRHLQANGHRCLIFTQMSKMLDILQSFLAHHGYVYFRLDGSTPVERRQSLMERFNSDPKVFCFILSTRAGGVGVNLIGADSVIFYDSDWNPTMDAQAQDRCHRIGQTKDVTIYRLISRNTIEENILKKAREKKRLGELAIDEAEFSPAFFKREDNIRDLFRTESGLPLVSTLRRPAAAADVDEEAIRRAMASAEDQQDVQAAQRAQAELEDESAEFAAADHAMPDMRDAESIELWESLSDIEKFAVSAKLHDSHVDAFC
ncbi:hypothetical protein M3Y99_00899400 [Aphelenchoides fujianensis]|nr:hypothetical protein M3Y99_00899400 [Aphelenchoides fujianensis]